MPSISKSPAFYLAIAITILTWLLILLGGVVHGTESSLACPDWPTCYGSFFPEMKGGVAIEHSHRLVASLVGLLTIVLSILLWRRAKNSLRNLGLVALLLVVFQGVLGGITVLYKLPTLVSTAHLGTSMIFFGVLIWISASLYDSSLPSTQKLKVNRSRWVLLVLGIVYLQLVLGGLVRHLGAGLACVDIPLCQGSLWPPNAPAILKIHMAHRILAFIVVLAVTIMGLWIFRHSSGKGWLQALSLSLPFMVLLQVLLGFLSVLTALELVPVTAHLGLAALIWGFSLLVYYFYQQEPS